MSRRKKSTKREIYPDTRYGSVLVSQLINIVMKNGKKYLAQRIVYLSLQRVSEKLEKGDIINILLGVLENTRPKIEVKSRRVGGATYQIPIEISYERQISLSFRCITNLAKKRKGMNMIEALTLEILDAYNNIGNAVKKKDEIHKMAQANKAFAHLRW